LILKKVPTDLKNDDETPTPEQVKQKFEESAGIRKKNDTTILGVWDSLLSERETLLTEQESQQPETLSGPRRTIRNERASFQTFKAYLEKVRKTNLTFKGLDKEIISGYEKFLATYNLGVTVKEKNGEWASYSSDDSWRASTAPLPLWNTTIYNDKGWAKDAKPAPGPIADLPPDHPPSSVYAIYPKAHVPPFHYVNAVTLKRASRLTPQTTKNVRQTMSHPPRRPRV
jgi:hypothetical protein